MEKPLNLLCLLEPLKTRFLQDLSYIYSGHLKYKHFKIPALAEAYNSSYATLEIIIPPKIICEILCICIFYEAYKLVQRFQWIKNWISCPLNAWSHSYSSRMSLGCRRSELDL